MAFTFDPNLVSVVAGNSILGGWGDGTFIEAERDEDSFMKKIGADGEVARAKNRNLGGHITLSFLQTSPSNDVLSAFQQSDQVAGKGIFTFVINDQNGITQVRTADAWVKKPAKLVYAKEVQVWQWTIDVGTFEVLIGAGSN